MQCFFIAPTNFGVGLTSATLGLLHALEQAGLNTGYLKPISQHSETGQDDASDYLRQIARYHVGTSINFEDAKYQLTRGQRQELMESIVANYQELADNCDVVVVEGLVTSSEQPYINQLNTNIASTLQADVILLASARETRLDEVASKLRIIADQYGGLNHPRMKGFILNKTSPELFEQLCPADGEPMKNLPQLRRFDAQLLGCIPWTPSLIAPRTRDIARYLNAKVVVEGNIDSCRVERRILCARTAINIIDKLKPNTLVICPGDRDDIILVSTLVASVGVPLAGVLVTNGIIPDERLLNLCKKAIGHLGIPLISTELNSYDTATRLDRMNVEVPADDTERIEEVMKTVSEHLDVEWLKAQCAHIKETRLSPPAFRYQLVKRAQQANKRIVLPEGEEARTIQAAITCQQRGIAQCILLGRRDEIASKASDMGLELPEGLIIMDPAAVADRYIQPMMKLREHKGLQAPVAKAQLEDTVVLGTMMLALNEVDGLVAGALNTTANTIRPAFQLIKTREDSSLVSSIFFMLLPDQVFVYGDCAVNPDPSAEQLADIAIQSADSAATFGIEPRVAMISYSTGSSGTGADVDKVRQATELAKQRRPDLLIDGPLQYDAAAIDTVARSKAPDSPVAGKATVFVFPDLNTGNTTYKAVQRSADVISIGPMLQGLRKPVNDLSRGALVDDIVFTIALTAIQATDNDLLDA
jgi:phosphate acetyltransferase